MKYKKSRYNFVFDKKDKIWIYNTLSGAMISLAPMIYKKFEESLNSMEKEEPEIFNKLKQNGIIVEESLNEIELAKYLYWANKFNSETLNLTLVVTKMCNFDCVYCFEKKENLKYTDKDINRILKFLEKKITGKNRLSIGWFGGEPLLELELILDLSEKIRDIAEKYKVSMTQYMSTNGYFLTANNFYKLYNSGITSFEVTIDGPQQEHDRLRPLAGGKGTYDKIVNNLLQISSQYSSLLTSGKALITIRVNVSKQNSDVIKDWLNGSFPKELKDTTQIYFAMVAGGGEKESPANFILQRNDFLLSPDYDSNVILDITQYALDLGYNIHFDIHPTYINCGAESENNYIILPESKLAKCPVIMNVFAELNDNGNIVITKLPQYIKWMAKDPFSFTGTFEECKECPLLPMCGGGCTKVYYNTGRKGCKIFKYELARFLQIIRDIKLKKVSVAG